MAEATQPRDDSAAPEADPVSLLEEAEAQTAEAEARAAAALARARAAKLRYQALVRAAATDEQSHRTTEDSGDVAEGVDLQTAKDASGQAPPVEGSQSKRQRLRQRVPALSTILKVAAILAICACGGAGGYMLWQDRDTAKHARRAADVVASAKQGVVNMTSMDFNKAKEDVQRVLDGSTGEFRDEFQRRAEDFTSVVQQSKVVTLGTVTAAGIESIDEHSASVLVSATSLITNSTGAEDEPRPLRLRVTMTDDGGRYKISKVEMVP
jgi:Mce-associated membrane protein